MKGNNFITVSVRDPERVIFEGRCSSLTAVNSEGKFDILPRHVGFITLISGRLVLSVYKGSDVTIDFESGVLRCMNDIVSVYLGLESVTK